jgi:ABC-type polysaccharide/polyol phosphate transport system ATPase subunit
VTDVDIRLAHVSKTFRLPHERKTSLKEYFLHPFHRSTFDNQKALSDVTFEVPAGEFFGIIGANGSGKSTLLKIIARIYREDSGTVEIRGQLSPFIELGVGFNPELTGRDNIRINATLLGMSRRDLTRQFDEIVEFSELERFLDQKLKNYSSGMQVRLAYSIAIQARFDILLLDEVLAVGDAGFQEKCFATFARFRREGKTVVFVSHDLSAVKKHCDRVMLIAAGSVEHIGSPNEVVDSYLERTGQPGPDGVFGRPLPHELANSLRLFD